MNTKIALEFFTRCFRPEETIALLLRRENPATTTQRIVRLEQASTPRYLAWLAYENRNGSNVYVAANPLHSGSRKRTKDSIAEVRHLYIDIDHDGDNRLAALRESEDVPVPSIVLSTSVDKYQVLWAVEGFDFDQQESTLKLLAIAFGGDSACTDRNRVLRVPGFRNCKYDPAYPVTAQYPSDSTYHPADFLLDSRLLLSSSPLARIARTSPSGKNTYATHFSGDQRPDDRAAWAVWPQLARVVAQLNPQGWGLDDLHKALIAEKPHDADIEVGTFSFRLQEITIHVPVVAVEESVSGPRKG